VTQILANSRISLILEQSGSDVGFGYQSVLLNCRLSGSVHCNEQLGSENQYLIYIKIR